MAVDQLRLQVLLQAVDKASGALKNVATGSKATAQAIRAAQDEARKLEKLQNDASGYQRTSAALRGHARDLAQAKSKAEQYGQQLQEQRTRHSNIAASLRTARHAYNQITTAYQDSKITGAEYTRQIELARITLLSAEQAHGRSKASVDKYKAQVKNATDKVQQHTAAIQGGQERLKGYKARLEEAGLSTERLGAQKRSLKARIDAQTTAMARSKASYEQQMQVEKRLHALREKHGADMARLGMRGAMAAGAMMAGQRMGGALMRPVQAFADAESATSQLRAAMMRADGTVPPEFAKINELAERLGDKLPGTTADFINMMTMLQRQGMSTQTILGGMGEAAAYLGVQLKMPVMEAAEFAAKMQDATQTTEGDMMGLMDTIQRAFYLGVDPTNMLQGFTKVGAVMPYLGKKGLEASNMLAPMLVMMDQAGMKGEAAGNAIRKIVQMSMNEGKLGKANSMLQGTGVQLDFYDKRGKFAGFDNLFAQLQKLKTIENDVQRTAVMQKLFGDDAETHQALNTLMEKGRAGYDETVAKLQAQADLRRRVNAELDTLANQAEAAQGSFTNMLKELGAAIAPELKALLKWLGDMANRMRQWAQENQKLVKAMMLVAAGAAALLTVGGALGVALVAVLGPLAAVRFLVARLGLGMLAAKVGAAGGVSGFGMLGRAVGGLWRMLTRFPLVTIALGIATALHSISQKWDAITAAWKDGDGHTIALSVLQAFVDGVDAMFLGLPSAIANIIRGAWDLLTGAGWEIGKALVGGVIAAIEGILNALTAGLYGTAKGALGKAWDYVTGGDADKPGASKARSVAAAAAVAAAAPISAVADSALLDRYQPMQMAPRAQTAAGGSTTNNITINATPGMDEKAMARAMTFELDRRERAKRSRVLSSMSDID